jgi:hypothetical protein
MTVMMPASARALADGRNWHDQCGWRGDVAQSDDFCAFSNAAPDLFDNRAMIIDRQSNRLRNIDGAALIADIAPGAFDCTVFVIAAQNLIARSKIERAGHDVHRIGDVGHKHNIIGRSADERRETRPCFRQ